VFVNSPAWQNYIPSHYPFHRKYNFSGKKDATAKRLGDQKLNSAQSESGFNGMGTTCSKIGQICVFRRRKRDKSKDVWSKSAFAARAIRYFRTGQAHVFTRGKSAGDSGSKL
jgi:hypothetical protein